MKRIPLTKGKEALVDDQDYDYLMQWRWHLRGGNRNGRTLGKYAGRWDWSSGQRTGVYMHTVVARRMGITGVPDHRNRDGLDNRRRNLRPTNAFLNQANRSLFAVSTSGYKGVTRHKGKWQVQITVRGETICLGRFDDKSEAARAYNEAALRYFGEFAVLNPV